MMLYSRVERELVFGPKLLGLCCEKFQEQLYADHKWLSKMRARKRWQTQIRTHYVHFNCFRHMFLYLASNGCEKERANSSSFYAYKLTKCCIFSSVKYESRIESGMDDNGTKFTKKKKIYTKLNFILYFD